MTDKKIETGDLQKALAALTDLAKGHGSRGTATTAVETMVGESGSTQIFHTASNSDPGGWAGSSWKGEGWEDSIDANGTDLNAVKKLGKSIAEGILAKCSKGQSLSAREVNFMSKGGMDFLKDKDDDKDAKKAFPPKKDDEVEKAHADAAEDREQIKDMVKPGSIKKSDVSKSLLDHAAENPAVSNGLELSEFLAGFAQVVNKSHASSEARIVKSVVDRVLTALAAGAEEQATVSKSMAGALASLGEVLAAQAQRVEQIESGPARGAKSQVSVQKSGVAPSPIDGGGDGIEGMSKSMIAERLLDLVKKSEATPQDVLKFDASGYLSNEMKRKIAR